MSELQVGKVYQDKFKKSLFRVLKTVGDLGYQIYCENGAWYATYDHEMKMICDLREWPWGLPHFSKGIHRLCLVEPFEDIGYGHIGADK